MKIFPKLSPGDNCLAIKFFRLNPPALLYAFFPRISHRSFIARRPPFRPVTPPHIRNASRLSARGSPASSSPTNHPPECSPHFRPAGSPFLLQEVAPIACYRLQRLPRLPLFSHTFRAPSLPPPFRRPSISFRIRDKRKDYCYNGIARGGIPVHIVDPLAGTLAQSRLFYCPQKGKERSKGNFPASLFSCRPWSCSRRLRLLAPALTRLALYHPPERSINYPASPVTLAASSPCSPSLLSSGG